MSRAPEFVYESPDSSVALQDPTQVFAVHAIDEVMPALQQADACVANGQIAAGYIAYEAAPAFDAALTCHAPGELPLVWIGVYDPPEKTGDCASTEPFAFGDWQPLIGPAEYHHAINAIRHWIAAGETYQINYTFPLDTTFEGNPLAAYRALRQAQGGGHTAYVNAGRFQILSASPELFLQLNDGLVTSRPMKGTRARGLWSGQDEALAQTLHNSEKDRAENVMIVDMIRNDLGRVAEPGTIDVKELFTVERYPTVWQMTSTVQARTNCRVPEILAAMFPCASVTGAPKVQTMRRIRELEPAPRGAYCGTCGWWGPDGRAEFNVAIRTVTIDTKRNAARYHVGSGITWYSNPAEEFEECEAKAAVLTHTAPEFELLESLLFDGEFFLLERHLDRLEASARYFAFAFDRERMRSALLEEAGRWSKAPQKVRVLCGETGAFRIEAQPIAPEPELTAGLAEVPVNSRDRFLYHKTTHRGVYERALAARPDCRRRAAGQRARRNHREHPRKRRRRAGRRSVDASGRMRPVAGRDAGGAVGGESNSRTRHHPGRSRQRQRHLAHQRRAKVDACSVHRESARRKTRRSTRSGGCNLNGASRSFCCSFSSH
jgi:para-aminobenzoate synthetase / 4-amino-4-deoxychorismate lyase